MISAGTSQSNAHEVAEPTRPRLALFLLDKSLPDVWTYATKEHPGLMPPKDVIHVVFMTETSRPTSMDPTRSRYTVRGPAAVYWPGLDAPHAVHGNVDDALHAMLYPSVENPSQLVVVGTRNRHEVLEAAFHLARGLESTQVALVCWPRDVDWSLDEWADQRGLFGSASLRYKSLSTANLIAHWEETLDRDQRQILQRAASNVTKMLEKQANFPLTADTFYALLPTPWTVPIDRNLVFSHLLRSSTAPACDVEYWGPIECVAEFLPMPRQPTRTALRDDVPSTIPGPSAGFGDPRSPPQRTLDDSRSGAQSASVQQSASLRNTFSMLDEELKLFLSLDLTGNMARSNEESSVNHDNFTAVRSTAATCGPAHPVVDIDDLLNAWTDTRHSAGQSDEFVLRSTATSIPADNVALFGASEIDPVPDLIMFFDQVLADIYDRTGRPDLPPSPVDLAAECFDPTTAEMADLLGDTELSASRTTESSPQFEHAPKSPRAADSLARSVGEGRTLVLRMTEFSPLIEHAPESLCDANSPARSAWSRTMVPSAETTLPHVQELVSVAPIAGSSRGVLISRNGHGTGGGDSISSSEEFDSESASGDEMGEVGMAHNSEQQGVMPPPHLTWQQSPPAPAPVPHSDEKWRVVPKPRVTVQAPVGDDSGELVALAKMHVVMMQADKTDKSQYKSGWLGKPLQPKSNSNGMKIGKF
ncbi:hypothetical protein GGF31_008522 [Allomyces arbusculus]|nr:hypothetical protein GGF31_008522 [Allomyces arbusculus]